MEWTVQNFKKAHAWTHLLEGCGWNKVKEGSRRWCGRRSMQGKIVLSVVSLLYFIWCCQWKHWTIFCKAITGPIYVFKGSLWLQEWEPEDYWDVYNKPNQIDSGLLGNNDRRGGKRWIFFLHILKWAEEDFKKYNILRVFRQTWRWPRILDI